jgi:CheY-like chemotaxis protein
MRALNIMIVDDHSGFRALLREVLESCAAVLQFGSPRFVECDCAEEALSNAAAAAPDLITMDLRLPGMDGTECIRQLRRLLPRAVMIIVTHLREQWVTDRAIEAGADAVVFKDDLSVIPRLLRDGPALGPRP